jgi:hypothetical protein
MQLQEDKCRPGHMQLKAEASAVLGVHLPFSILRELGRVSTSALCIPSRISENQNREADRCIPVNPVASVFDLCNIHAHT